MRNICLVALLSLVSVLVPVVFFVLDISKPALAAWGDYVRWVGAAAASVVVWEWVERIEALERNEKKDGVLGREIFDGDEMLEVTPASDWTKRFRKDNDDKGGGGYYRPRATNDLEAGPSSGQRTSRNLLTTRPPLWPTRPQPAATPVNRSDTASAESTVYAVRYHPISEATPPIIGRNTTLSRSNSGAMSISRSINGGCPVVAAEGRSWPWNSLNPFRHRVQGPPAEVSLHTVKPVTPFSGHECLNRWDMRARIEGFAATQAERFREKTRPPQSIQTHFLSPIRKRAQSTQCLKVHLIWRIDTSGRERPTRTSDPYTPDSLQRHSITHRGSISFATTVQPEMDQRVENITSSPTLVASRNTPTYSSSRSSPLQARSPVTPALPPIIDGLPVTTIPAPPRRPRVEDP
ncbi:hypothetical protein DID88_007305 [Monilinia fructigena]|uniref:Uncharacterized protein n=1 Tax=Monilinia fructigena TaxID=38457 RepID=A0A395J8M5_9HELO|nr:hypothetical protein DID88_007305 [Monilinia fructigena]